jgi:FkbM family methyltransferase
VSILRKLLFPIFARINPGDITIRHHWTGRSFYLHSFRHRGYWWHGRERERKTMEQLQAQIARGDTVWDVGANIGYMTDFFSSLAASVVAFEPAEDNLRYLRRNLPPNAKIISAAATDRDAEDIPLYVESLTGQNCSLIPDYKIFVDNAQHSGYAPTEVQHVRTTTLDTFAAQTGRMPDWVKIDVEGAELNVLRGMQSILSSRGPRLMVEMTRQTDEVETLLTTFGYRCHHRFGNNTFWERSGSASRV